MTEKNKSVRITLFLIAVIVTFGLIGLRLFDLAYVNHEYYSRITDKRRVDPEELNRGDVYIKSADGPILVATTKNYPIIFVSPRDVEDRFETAKAITELLKIDRRIVDKALVKENDPYEVLIQRATNEQVQKVSDSDIKGLRDNYEEGR